MLGGRVCMCVCVMTTTMNGTTLRATYDLWHFSHSHTVRVRSEDGNGSPGQRVHQRALRYWQAKKLLMLKICCRVCALGMGGGSSMLVSRWHGGQQILAKGTRNFVRKSSGSSGALSLFFVLFLLSLSIVGRFVLSCFLSRSCIA